MGQIWEQPYPFTSWPWLYIPPNDYCIQSVVGDTCTFTYKLGGASGTVVATVTVVYTDATLSTIVSVTKV